MDFFDQAKERVSLLLLLYPVAIGLYAVGFFWDLPRDIISYFDVVPFCFKASIVYLSITFFIVVSLMIAAMVYSPILKLGASSGEPVASADKYEATEPMPWSSMSQRRKLFWGGLSLCILFAVAFAVWIDPPSIKSAPNAFMTILTFTFFCGMAARPFFAKNDWKVAVVLFFSTFVLLLPVVSGYADAEVSPTAPQLGVGEGRCPVIFATSETIVGRCSNSVAILVKDAKTPLVWQLD